jgi:hypothetical protein
MLVHAELSCELAEDTPRSGYLRFTAARERSHGRTAV